MSSKHLVATIAEVKQDKPEPPVCSDDPNSPQGRLMLRFERFSLLLKTASSQQESEDVIKRIDELYNELVGKSSVESALPPATVISQKGRPKSTKREKLGIEHEDHAIKQESKKRKADEILDLPKNKQPKKQEKKQRLNQVWQPAT